MDRTVKTVIGGKERELNYSIEVMFHMRDRFESIQKALEIIASDTKESFEAVRWFAVQMANDGELCRREAGYDHLPLVSAMDISLRMKPLDYELLKGAVIDAITLGYKRELKKEDEETDLGLEELRSKKAEAVE